MDQNQPHFFLHGKTSCLVLLNISFSVWQKSVLPQSSKLHESCITNTSFTFRFLNKFPTNVHIINKLGQLFLEFLVSFFFYVFANWNYFALILRFVRFKCLGIVWFSLCLTWRGWISVLWRHRITSWQTFLVVAWREKTHEWVSRSSRYSKHVLNKYLYNH